LAVVPLFLSNILIDWAIAQHFFMIVGTTEAESWRCRLTSRQTFQEAAQILNISTARLRVLLMAGRVEGAYKRKVAPVFTRVTGVG
jgi:predicted phage gp36 major capsid-like protein